MKNESLDKFEITQTINAYMHAIDTADSDALRNRVFAPDGTITLLEPLDVNAYCDFVKAIMQEIRTQHFVTNSLVDVDGDQANVKSYFMGFHRVPASPNSEACEAIFGNIPEEMDVIIGGLYRDAMVRLPQGWRIHNRQITLLWDNRGLAGNLLSPDWMA